mgnify:CR=1 FL=1
MVAQEKTFVHLESHILPLVPKMTPRDLSHVMYAYSVRGAGNPELHSAFEKRLEEVADQMDYPAMHNAIYYMLFKENEFFKFFFVEKYLFLLKLLLF